MSFKYTFEFPDRPPEDFLISIGKHPRPTGITKELPAWTELGFHDCPHCPLDASTVSHCPLAARISAIIDRFEALISHEHTKVTVTTEDRTYSCDTTVQHGLGSLLGLVIATSDCPHTKFLRPMAHFHLPISSTEETIYRVVGMYFIGQYFRKIQGKEWDLDLTGLIELYEGVETVNLQLVKRLRAIAIQDAPLNAIVLLDSFAKNMGYAIREQLEEIRHLWVE